MSNTKRSCMSCNWCIRNMMMMLMTKATNVELNATPRLAVTPAMSPSTALYACPSAPLIPRTVPMKPMDGIAHAI